MEPRTQAAHMWTPTETHTLLDLIRDMDFTQALTQNSNQNRHVFERLCVLLGRCNSHVSPVEVKWHWQALKMKFFHLKRLRDLGMASAITVDFPFYEEMDQLLTPHSKTKSCKREADSSVSGLEVQNFPSPSDYEDQAASSRNQEADDGPDLNREAPSGDAPGDQDGRDVQRLLVMLYHITQQLVDATERLSEVERQLSTLLRYICSAALPMTHQLYNVPPEQHFSWGPAHNPGESSSPTLRSRVVHQGVGQSFRHHP